MENNTEVIEALEKLAHECVDENGEVAPDWWSTNAGEDFMNLMHPGIFVVLVAELRAMQEAARWIPVAEDKRPESGEFVLVKMYRPKYKRKIDYAVATFDHQMGWWETGITVLHNVTDWRYIEPPQTETL